MSSPSERGNRNLPSCTKARLNAGPLLLDQAVGSSNLRALAGWDLVVLAVLAPLVEHVVHGGDVTLLVVADRAQHGVPLAGLDGLGDLFGVGRLGLGDGLRPDLHRGVGVE